MHWLRGRSGCGIVKQPILSASYTTDRVPLDLRTGVAAQQAFKTVLVNSRDILQVQASHNDRVNDRGTVLEVRDTLVWA
mgnify:CR=1 FL=1